MKAASEPDLEPVYDRLRAILAPYRDWLPVASDKSGGVTLERVERAGR